MSDQVAEVPPYKLIYFDIRGMAEPIRWMFALAGVPFIDERVHLAEWNRVKRRFDNHAGQLPILKFEDQELTQVLTVTRFLARRLGFSGTSDMEETRADEAAELIYELRLCATASFRECFHTKTPAIVRHTVFRDFHNETSNEKKEQMKTALLENHIPKYFTKLEELIQENEGEFVAGPALTYADLAVVNFLEEALEMIGPDILVDYPALQKLRNYVLELPAIKQWNENKPVAQAA